MWEPQIVDYSKVRTVDIDSLLSGRIPAIVVKNFYKKDLCRKIITRIENCKKNYFLNGQSMHIGTFLMAYATQKELYFEDVKKNQYTINGIFSKIKNPALKIHEFINSVMPHFDISQASEFNSKYSPFIVRIYEKGKSIPIHKDNVKYEGIEYEISKIDHQLSCVLHLQESECGGNLVIYNKQWNKENEVFRNIDFGYSSKLISSVESCEIANIASGDLVIINPNYYHKVTKITGKDPRITLGMFLGIFDGEQKIVTWA